MLWKSVYISCIWKEIKIISRYISILNRQKSVSVLADELALAYISKKKDASLLSNKIKWRSLSESSLLKLNENHILAINK